MNQKENPFGPLQFLIGTWEGDKGMDTAPNKSRETMDNAFRERIVFEAIGPVRNHEQTLYGVKYHTSVWTLETNAPFHDEMGYYLWCEKSQEIIKSFVIPRGMSVNAGGKSSSEATEFNVTSQKGASVYGLSSSPFLDQEFQTTEYHFKLQKIDENTFSYEQHTMIQMKNSDKTFDHKDINTLSKVSS